MFVIHTTTKADKHCKKGLVICIQQLPTFLRKRSTKAFRHTAVAVHCSTCNFHAKCYKRYLREIKTKKKRSIFCRHHGVVCVCVVIPQKFSWWSYFFIYWLIVFILAHTCSPG